MRAMILAAGRGERLRPLTDTCPKPLLKVQGKPLIEYHIRALKEAGIEEIIINVAYLKETIQTTLGSGQKWGVHIEYSIEDPVLQTGGGIYKALPLLGPDPFIVLSADLFTDFPFSTLVHHAMPRGILAHLILIHHSQYPPDFGLQGEKIIKTPFYTYGGIGLYKPELFSGCTKGAFPLGPLLHHALEQETLSGAAYEGVWENIGTAPQLKNVQKHLLFLP